MNGGRKFEEIFKKAEVPDLLEFSGEYSVDMLTILPSLRKFAHRKYFSLEKGKVTGYNVLFSKKVWGHFFLEEGVCEELGSIKVAIINYNVPGNPPIFKRMMDEIRCVKKGSLYIGRFNYLIKGKPHFFGYFSLSKV